MLVAIKARTAGAGERMVQRKHKASAFAAHDVIGYLLDHESELSRSHGKIAQAILHDPTGFVEKPIEELVVWLGAVVIVHEDLRLEAGRAGGTDLGICPPVVVAAPGLTRACNRRRSHRRRR